MTGKFNQAQKLEKDGKWEASENLYREIGVEVQRHLNTVDDYRLSSEALSRTVKLLSEGDDLLRTFWKLLELPIRSSDWKAHYALPGIGPHIHEYIACVTLWKLSEMDRLNGRLNRADGSSLASVSADLEKRAIANNRALKKAIDDKLRETRKNINVAFISMNHTDADETVTYSWLYQSCSVSWFAPDAKGELKTLDGRAFRAKDYQVVWIHQPNFLRPVEKGKPVVPSVVLMPMLTSNAFISEMRSYLTDGGGLLLSGVAGLYTLPLKLETVQPNRIMELGLYPRNVSLGVAPAPGFVGHPALKGFPEDGKLGNGIIRDYNVVWECCWENIKPTGRVIANEYKDIYGRNDAVSVIVEYSCGRGKVLVMGGLGCNLNPNTLPAEPHYKVRERIREAYLGGLEYLSTPTQFAVSQEAAKKAIDSADSRVFLPVGGWQFAIDPKNEGQEKGWFKPEHPVDGWKKIRIDAQWESQGFEDYDGIAWYRLSFSAANKPGKRTYLNFYAVDEEVVAYVDGILVGKHEEGPSGWDKPFRFDITDRLSDKKTDHVLAVRVNDSLASGGIYKPVALIYE